jgi:hypothetical protein
LGDCIAGVRFLQAGVSPDEQVRLLTFAVALLIVAVPLSILSGRVYRHYYIPWLLPLGILSACFCFIVQSAGERRKKSSLVWILAWCILTLWALVGIRIRLTPLLAAGPPRESWAVADIQSSVPAGQSLFIWGNETSYAVMAHRHLAGRIIYLTPLVTPGYGEPLASEVLADIAREHPVIIDTSPTDPNVPSLAQAPPYPYLQDFYSYIHSHYEIGGTIGADRWVLWIPK